MVGRGRCRADRGQRGHWRGSSDNKSAIELVKNSTFHSRTKHIAIRYHFVREAYNDGVIFLAHCGTEDMPADVFTKPLIRIKLDKFVRLLGLSQT